MALTGCNYGVHSFVFDRAFGSEGYDLHLHTCSECGAQYIRAGRDECFECKKVET